MTALKVNFLDYAGGSLQSDVLKKRQTCPFIQFAAKYLQENPGAKCFQSLLSALMNFTRFQESKRREYNTDEVGKELLDEFADYLHKGRHLKINTVKGLIQRMKYFLKKAHINGWAVDPSYCDARVRNEELFFIYLDLRDISRIYYFNDLTDREKELRDLFVVGCMTGQRFSDYSRITSNNIVGNNIQMLTKKTRARICVPVTRYVKEIFSKYNNNLPKPCCIQYFNKVIKEICRKVGMTELITYEREIAGRIVSLSVPKYMLVTSHTARRSFITNGILSNIQMEKLKNCTGLKSSACLSRYNHLSMEENARTLMGNLFFL